MMSICDTRLNRLSEDVRVSAGEDALTRACAPNKTGSRQRRRTGQVARANLGATPLALGSRKTALARAHP